MAPRLLPEDRMSSTYRILCVSHDPAIALEQFEFQSGDDGRARAEEAVATGVADHPNCDLLIGRYSYPLVEVGCPPKPRHSGVYHPHNTEWLDVFWLRLLVAAQRAPEGSQERQLATGAPGCWSPERLHRLRLELVLEA
jgi:hypothetical protein